MKIAFNQPYLTGRELSYMRDCLERGSLAGNGVYTKKAQEFMQDKFGAHKVLLTTSGTSALEMAALLGNLQPGDEVIMPSFTFVSTANAVMLRGAMPVFADINPDTLNIDPAKLEAAVNERTRAIIPVHYAGLACDMDKIMDIASRHNLLVIEDAAQGVNARYKDRCLGTIGHIGCYSFHGTKNYVCGEGGAILINCSEPQLAERAEIIWEKGTNRSQFLRGEADKYSWMDIGSSFLPADILAAFLYAQLEELEQITALRKELYQIYWEQLLPYSLKGVIQLPGKLKAAESNCHIFFILLNSQPERDWVLFALQERGIQAAFHYIPLHSSPMGRKLGYQPADLPISEDVSGRLLRLPLYPQLRTEEQNYVLDNLKSLLDKLQA